MLNVIYNVFFAFLHVIGFPVDACMMKCQACRQGVASTFDKYFCCLKTFQNYLRRRNNTNISNEENMEGHTHSRSHSGIVLSPLVVRPERVIGGSDYNSLPTDEEAFPIGMKI